MDFCQNSGGNTGVGACDLSSSKMTPIGIIFVPKNASIPKSTTDVQAFLDGKFKENAKANRFYPVMGFGAVSDSSEEAQVATMALGYSEKIRNGNAIYQFDIPFSFCKAKKVIQFDGWKGGIYLILSTGMILGRKSTDGTKILPLIPLQLDITNAQLLSLGTTDARVVSIQANLDDKLRLVDVADFITIDDFDKDGINGIIDIELSIAAQEAGYVDVFVKTKCDGVNLFDVYTVELAAGAVWKLTNATTGAEATITGVVAQAGTKSFRVSAPSGTYKLSLVDISALTTAKVEGYESNEITVTIV
ncbi:MAG: hypothetical protein LBC19_12980 [Tannerella sp.]|jgi:hypothetical protein|nr:hypothetical protein [Tannerella sp.]